MFNRELVRTSPGEQATKSKRLANMIESERILLHT
jgi:hypothetical protein